MHAGVGKRGVGPLEDRHPEVGLAKLEVSETACGQDQVLVAELLDRHVREEFEGAGEQKGGCVSIGGAGLGRAGVLAGRGRGPRAILSSLSGATAG
eukprot:4032699-Pyramimonas_sp.AAC.1